jgi:Kef-type K+ transport system membrane component KefB
VLLRSRPATVLSAALLPLFFALPALRVDLGALGADGWVLFALVLAVAAASKLLSAGVAARLSGLPPREAMTVGALMNARGLVELVVLAVGLEVGLVDERLFAVMVLMALTTTFATGPLVDRIGRVGARSAPQEPFPVSHGAGRRPHAQEAVDAA